MMTPGKTASSEVIVLMSSVHEHLVMENSLEKEGILYRTLVKPRQLGSDCGLVLGIKPEDLTKIKQIATSRKIQIYGVFIKEDDVWKNKEP